MTAFPVNYYRSGWMTSYLAVRWYDLKIQSLDILLSKFSTSVIAMLKNLKLTKGSKSKSGVESLPIRSKSWTFESELKEEISTGVCEVPQ